MKEQFSASTSLHYNMNCLSLSHERNGVKIMEITDVRVRKISSAGKMKAIVSVTFDEAFVIHDIKVIEGRDRLFIAMPSRKTVNGEFKDIAHPINTELRERLQETILKKYDEAEDNIPVGVVE